MIATLQKIRPYLPLIFLCLAGYLVVTTLDNRQGGTDPKRQLIHLTSAELPQINRDDVSLGDAVTISSFFTNEPVLLNFWASWCQVCRQEKELLVQLAKTVPVVGIVAYDELQALKQSGQVQIRQYPLLYDGEGQFARFLGVRGLPHSVLVDRDGYVRKTYEGPLTANRVLDIQRLKKELQAEPSKPSESSAE